MLSKEQHISIVANIGKELPFAYADIALIERVLENALRYTPEEGSVSVVMNHVDSQITVQISDTGRGIPVKDLPSIFDRFYQLDKSRKGKSGHSGFGIAITKRILDLHGASIQVQSAINTGTTFPFDLLVHISE